jgi:hypothetical protein
MKRRVPATIGLIGVWVLLAHAGPNDIRDAPGLPRRVEHCKEGTSKSTRCEGNTTEVQGKGVRGNNAPRPLPGGEQANADQNTKRLGIVALR